MTTGSKMQTVRRAFLLWLFFGALASVSSSEAETPEDLVRHPPQPRINELYRSPERLYLDLNGPWMATLKELPDPGAAEDGAFDMSFHAPGCLEGQGLGLDIPPVTVDKPPHHGNIYGMQHGRQPGDPTFRRRFTIPGEWKDKRIHLGIGGVSGHCRVWLDGKPVPELNNPITAVGVQADLTDRLRPGEHVITIVGEDPGGKYVGMYLCSHYWRYRGLWRGVELVAVDPFHLADVHVVGDPGPKTFRVAARLSRPAPKGCMLRLRVRSCDGRTLLGEAAVDIDDGATRAVASVVTRGLAPWSHRAPNLARIDVSLEVNKKVVDTLIERSGLRRVALQQEPCCILINGRPTFMAGEMVINHPPGHVSPLVDRDVLRRRYQAFKDAGFNLLRMHTTVAHPELLDVCDELGLYVQTETMSLRYGEMGIRIWRDAMLRDRNHPCLIAFCLDNERPIGKGEKAMECMRLAYELDGSRLYATGSPGRIMLGPKTVGPKSPITHETAKMASYPDPALLEAHPDPKDTWHIAWVGARLEKAGLTKLWPRFASNSQMLQARAVAAYYQQKRLKHYAGCEHCTVFDAYAWMWGILDDWAKPKTPASFMDEIRWTMADTAILISTPIEERSLTSGAQARPGLTIAHYGAKRVAVAELSIDGKTIGRWPDVELQPGTTVRLPECEWTAPEVSAPRRLIVHALLSEGDETIARQRWRYWVFPRPSPVAVTLESAAKPSKFHAVSHQTLSEQANGGGRRILLTEDARLAEDALASGRRVLLLAGPPPKRKRAGKGRAKEAALPELPGMPGSGTAAIGAPGCPSDWGPGRPYTGNHATLIDSHPALEGLPHEGWAEECFISAARGGPGKPPFARYYGGGWSVWVDSLAGLTPVISTIPAQTEEVPRLGTWLAVKEHESGGRLVLCTLKLSRTDPLGRWLAHRLLVWLGK